MALSSLAVLMLQSVGMAVGTFLCGIVPLYLSLSKTKLRILEVLGTGLLVGASMTVVLPEGVNALFQAKVNGNQGDQNHDGSILPAATAVDQSSSHAWAWSMMRRHAEAMLREHPYNPESAMGMALLSGFLIMFLIDQVASPGAHAHAHPPAPPQAHAQDHRDSTAAHSNQWAAHARGFRTESMRLTRASSLHFAANKSSDHDHVKASGGDTPHSVGGNGAGGRNSQHTHSYTSVESTPEQMPADHDFVTHLQDPLLSRQESGNGPGDGRRRMSDAARSTSSSTIRHSRSVRHAFASIAGLIIHAAADGIAMGASAGSGDDSLKLVVLFAIMIHKAPASFGLCTLLMGQRLHKSDVRRALAIFSCATPIGALSSYLILASLLGKSDNGTAAGPPVSTNGISPQHIGAALTFSAGTFLFVAMHAVQELASAAADVDMEESHHHHHHHHHHVHHHQTASSSSAREDLSSALPPAAPKQILGRTGRVAVFVLGTILPKVLQTVVGHPH